MLNISFSIYPLKHPLELILLETNENLATPMVGNIASDFPKGRKEVRLNAPNWICHSTKIMVNAIHASKRKGLQDEFLSAFCGSLAVRVTGIDDRAGQRVKEIFPQ